MPAGTLNLKLMPLVTSKKSARCGVVVMTLSEAAERYEKLCEVLSDMHRSGECSEGIEEAFHDAMDFLWWRMSAEECEDFERKLRDKQSEVSRRGPGACVDG